MALIMPGFSVQVRAGPPVLRLEYASTAGKSRTSATNFSSNGEALSFRQIRASGNGNFKSVTGSSATLSGHRQRVALLTNATPSPHDTRLRIVRFIDPFLNDVRRFEAPRKHSCI